MFVSLLILAVDEGLEMDENADVDKSKGDSLLHDSAEGEHECNSDTEHHEHEDDSDLMFEVDTEAHLLQGVSSI
jgi:hypothetical protein